MTGVLSSSSANTVRKNAIVLPAYTPLLGLIAVLGYMGDRRRASRYSPRADVVPSRSQGHRSCRG